MGGRAVEGTGLENRQGRKSFVGSNPTPSAILFWHSRAFLPDLGHGRWRNTEDRELVTIRVTSPILERGAPQEAPNFWIWNGIRLRPIS